MVLIRIRRHTGSLCSPQNLKQTMDTDPSLPTDTEKRSAWWKYVGYGEVFLLLFLIILECWIYDIVIVVFMCSYCFWKFSDGVYTFKKCLGEGSLDPTFLFTQGVLHIIKCLISPSLKEINNAVTVSSVNTLLLTSSAFNRKIYLIQKNISIKRTNSRSKRKKLSNLVKPALKKWTQCLLEC